MNNSWIIWDHEVANLFLEGEDQLWSKEYADQLFSIVKNLSNEELKWGFNIWLYWWWGSGKTSIINSLLEKIRENESINKKFEIINFDSWKYSKDDLRRSVLVKMLDDPKDIEKLEENIYKMITKSEEETNISRKRVWIYVGVSIVIWLAWWYLRNIITSKVFYQCNWQFAAFISIVSIIASIGKELVDKFKETVTIKNTVSFTKNSIFSTEEFEKEFKNILIGQWYSSKYKDKKILFVFDNIDRCDPDTVKEILMTIKTFLNQDDCIFILPIDYNSVCKNYHKDYTQWDEYLRKIFNLWVHIKKPQYDKLYQLVEKIIENNKRKTQLWITEEEAQEISYILASIFADNPRKIKQFLNKLWAEHILYKKKKPILSLLKKLLLEQETPELFKYLNNNLSYAQEIINMLESFWWDHKKYKEDISKNTYEIYKDIPEISKKDLCLLHELSIINDKLPLFDWNKEYLMGLLKQPNQIVDYIKQNKDKKVMKSFIEENISLVRKSFSHARDVLNMFIYYTAELWINQKLFSRMFKKWSMFYEVFGLDNKFLNIINRDILFRFVNNISIENIKNLGVDFANWFMRLILSVYDENVEYFDKLIEEKKEHLMKIPMLEEMFLDDSQTNLEQEIVESPVFKLVYKYTDFVSDSFMRNLMTKIPQSISALWSWKINNILKIINNRKDLNKSILNITKTLTNEQFNLAYIQNYSNATYKLITDNYLSYACIILQHSDNIEKNIIENLINIYQHCWGNQKIQTDIKDCFKNDIEIYWAYDWPYTDFVINQNIEELLILMMQITKNDENWSRAWLSDIKINEIIQKIQRSDEKIEFIKSIRTNPISRNVLIKNLENNSLWELYNKIRYMKNHGFKINKTDRKNIWHMFEGKIQLLLQENNINNLDVVCDFLINNKEFIEFVDNNKIKKLLSEYPIENFKTLLTADIYESYNNKIKEALTFLKYAKE